jgi:hypothetical protein
MRRSHLRFLWGLPLALVVTMAAGPAGAQCLISGPDSVACGTSATLCGPSDGSDFMWTLPDGSMAFDPCISATEGGTYSLLVFNGVSGLWFGPCTMNLTVTSDQPAPAITGSSTGCIGSAVTLCGPTGTLEYEWTGSDGGFLGAGACLDVWASGSYQLRVRPTGGCWSPLSAQSVTIDSCGGGGGGGDTTGTGGGGGGGGGGDTTGTHALNCPRPAWWWAAQCPRDDHRNRVDASVLLPVATCVSSQVSFMAGGDASFCSVMQPSQPTLRGRARRQVATVWANVCAGLQGVTARDGQAVALSPTTVVSLGSYTGTVREWLDWAASEMARLSSMNERNRAVRNSYRSIIRTAWNINHGIGIGATCFSNPPQATASTGADAASGDADAMLVAGMDPEPLSTQVMDDLDGPLELGTFEPNPFSASSRLAFAISTTTNQDVTIGVYDISGRLVKELVRGSRAPGQYEVRWDGKAENGAQVQSGMYFVLGRIGGQQVQTRVTFVH